MSYSAILQSIRPLPLYFSAQCQLRQSPEVSRKNFFFGGGFFFWEGTENLSLAARSVADATLLQAVGGGGRCLASRDWPGQTKATLKRLPLGGPKEEASSLPASHCVIFLRLGRYKRAIELGLVFTLNGVNLFQDSLFQRNSVSRQRVKNPIRRE